MDRVIDLIDDNTGSSDQESGSEPGSVKGRSVGRPVGHFRKNYFITLDDVPKKNNRVVVQCKFCHISMDSRADTLQDHILEHCKKVTQETRQVAEKHVQAAIKPTAGKRPPTSLSRTSSKKEKQEQQGASTGPMGKFLHAAVKPQQQIAVNRKLLRFLVLNSIPFRAVDSPFFLDFVGSLNITYTPAGATQLRTRFLREEFIAVRGMIQEKIEKEHNLTVNLDGWTDNAKHSVYTCNVIFSDRSMAQYDCLDLPDDAHTADRLTELMETWIRRIGPERVGALCTDNAAAMRLAREQTVQRADLTHIVELRCMMHSFSLVVGSLLGHPWAKDIIKRAQRVVTYFNASTRAHSLLMEAAMGLGISGQLQTSNTTRFTSVHIMLQSVMKMQDPLRAVLNRHPEQIMDKHGLVKVIIADRQFWASAEVLSALLEPFSQVVMAIQSKTANLADTTRYWLYLAKSFKAELPKLTSVGDFQRHCIAVFNMRCKELNLPICRLALFLDPRYKAAVDTPAGYRGLIETAVTLMRNRLYSADDCGKLITQLAAYKGGSSPFDAPLGNLKDFNAQLWWRSIDSSLIIVQLAVFLYDIVPHAATTERIFSIMSWYHTAVRNRLSVGTTGRMSAIKTFYEQSPPSIAAKAAAVDAAVGDALSEEAGAGEEGSTVQTVEDLEIRPEDIPTDENLDRTLDPFYVLDKELYEAARDPNISFTELLLGDPEQGFALDADVLAANYVPLDHVSVPIGVLGTSAAGAAPFDVSALIASYLQR